MKFVQKTIRPRLPQGVVEKLQEAKGGGRHADKKKDYRRQPKHRQNQKDDFGN